MTDNDKTKPQAAKGRGRILKTRPRAETPSIAEPQAPQSVAEAPEATEELEAIVEHTARFQFFLIDTGWDGAAARVVRQNLRMITQLQNHDPFYVLTRNQSNEILRKHPHLIGKDPIILVRDIHGARSTGEDQYHGFHLNLGIIQKPEQALEVLQNFVNFLAVHRRSADIDRIVRQKLHRDGLEGAVEVLRGSSESLI
jgi:hypothetical protein